MIDFLALRMNFKHTPFGNMRYIQDEGSSIMTAKPFSKKVELLENGAKIDVTSLDDGKQISIRCCPLKPFQGHNVFGTDNVKGLGYKLIEHVLTVLNLPPTAKQLASWKRGDFDIDELHITYRHAVTSHAMVARTLAHLARNLPMKFRPGTLERGIGIRLHNPDTGAHFIMYDKLREFDDKRTREQRYLHAVAGAKAAATSMLIRKEAASNIRSELKLDKRYLERHQLNKALTWSRSQVRSIYIAELEALHLGSVPSMELALQLLDQIDDKKVRATFFQWMHGENLKEFHGRQTLPTRRKAILDAVGIDIYVDRVPNKEPAIAIHDIFTASNILPNFPNWADKYPEVSYRGKTNREA